MIERICPRRDSNSRARIRNHHRSTLPLYHTPYYLGNILAETISFDVVVFSAWCPASGQGRAKESELHDDDRLKVS